MREILAFLISANYIYLTINKKKNMKSKILFQIFLLAGLGIIFTTLKSNTTGKFNNGLSCAGGGCHGSLSTATTVAITGLPTTFTTGTTYPVTVTVTNSNAALTKGGFNMATTGGTFIAGTGSKINGSGSQITHTAPMSASAGVTTFTFSWKAPNTTTPVIMSAAGNAVDDDGNATSNDNWNLTGKTMTGSFPASLNDVNIHKLSCYPNPTTDMLTIEGFSSKPSTMSIYNMFGQKFAANYSLNGQKCIVDCQMLPIGTYFIAAKEDGKNFITTFTKR